MKSGNGFSLVELLIVVAIISILSAIALPAYNGYVTRSKIIEATKNLSDGRVRMEQFFQDNRTYIGGLGCGANGDAITVFSDAQNFTYTCTTVNATAFTLTAAGVATRGMGGFSYTINQANAKTSTIAAPATGDGWATPAPNNCWTTNKGGKC